MNFRPLLATCLLLTLWGAATAQDSLQLRFMRAVEQQDARLVKELLKKDADVNMSIVATNPRYLFFISRKLYLEGMAKTRPGEIVYVSPIHANADHPDIKILKLLRSKRANIEAGDSDGKTPLMYALRNPGGEEYALYLLKKGANYRSVDLAGNTVMHYAAYGGNIQGLRMTAGGGVDPNARNLEGITPLHAAAVFSSIAVLEEIIGLGGDIHARDSAGMGALHYAAAYGDPTRLAWILTQAPELNDQAANGYTPLDIARAAKNAEAVEFLRAKGGRYGAYRYDEMIEAMRVRDHQLLRQVLADGADPNRRVREWPLVIAVLEDDVVSTELLLAAGAKPDVESAKGTPVLAIALAKANPSLALALVKAGTPVTRERMGQCLDQMAEAEQMGFWTDLVAAMVQAMPDRNAPCGRLDAPALHYAAYLGKEEMVEAILKAGANVNATDSSGWTALHWTVMKRDVLRLHLEKLRIAGTLLNAGAAVNPQAIAAKALPHTDPSLARLVPAHATPWDILSYALPTDADMAELLAAKGGKSGLSAQDFLTNGKALFAKRDYPHAQKDFGRAIAVDGKLAEAYYYHARCLEIAGQPADAERDLDKAVALQRNYPDALMARAKARIELQKWKAAEADVNAAMAQGFAKGEGLYWRGKIKWKSGQRDAACLDFLESKNAGSPEGAKALSLYCE